GGLFFFSSRRRHTRSKRDWSSDVCSSDLRGARRLGSPRGGGVAPGRVRCQSAGVSTLNTMRNLPIQISSPSASTALVVAVELTRSEERRVGKTGGARRVEGPGESRER